MSVIEPIHPGEILREEFLKPMRLSAYRVAKDIGVPINRITQILKEERDISAETALLLSRYLGLSDGYWTNLQAHYDMERARDALRTRLKHLTPFKDSSPVHPIV